jgi:two-component system, OmpR family, sensor histidine kinase KdpD
MMDHVRAPDHMMPIAGRLTRKETERLHALLGFLRKSALGVLGLAVLTAAALLLHLNLATIGPLYLLSIVVVALHWGFWQATVVSAVAVVCECYFFVPPVFSFDVADAESYLALIVFECSALIVSRLSAREQRNARDAEFQRRNLAQLYELSRKTQQLDLQQPPGFQLLHLIRELFAVGAVAIFDSDLDTIDVFGSFPSDAKELARNTCYFEVNQDYEDVDLSRRVLRLGTAPIGALLIGGRLNPLTVDAVASLVSITFDRYRSFVSETRAAAAHQTEQLRTTVLDGLAHAFKTPLTAIRTASSGLIELGDLKPAHADLAALIDEQAVLLNELTSRLLQTARLDAGQVGLKKQMVAIADLIEEVAAEQSGKVGDHELVISVTDKSLAARGDRELLAAIVTQFVDNAAKYSTPGSSIRISAQESASDVLIAVHNRGPLIRQQDRERIFERFYRCPETKHQAPGTGVGLSIAKKAAEVHNGHVWVISDEDEGTTFFLSILGCKGEVIDRTYS